MTPPLYAGFECSRLPWNERDILVETRHTPSTDMYQHYRDLPKNVLGARDGLPWRHRIEERIILASSPRLERIIWDMVHYDMPPDPEQHAENCQARLGPRGWAQAVNEPTIHAEFNREDGSWRTVETAIRMMRAAPHLNYVATDALCTLDPVRWWATDRLVETGMIKLVGINYYPHSADVPLWEIIAEVRRRYPGIAVAVTETGWHVGHPDLTPGDHRHDWLNKVMAVADQEGLEFVCWYPWLPMPDWNDVNLPNWECGYPV